MNEKRQKAIKLMKEVKEIQQKLISVGLGGANEAESYVEFDVQKKIASIKLGQLEKEYKQLIEEIAIDEYDKIAVVKEK